MRVFPSLTETTAPVPQSQMANDIQFVMEAGIEHHRKQECDEVAARYAIVLEADGDHVDAHYHIGVLYVQTDRPAEAVPHFEAALGHVPNFAQLWVYYVNALTASKQIEAARMALDLAHQWGVPADAIGTLKARLPQHDAATTPEPSTGAATEDAPKQRAPDTLAAKIDPRRASVTELRKFEELFNSGNNEAALKFARRLTKRNPSHGERWMALTYAPQRAGKYAVMPAEPASTLLPDSLDAQVRSGNALHFTRQFDRSVAHCRNALEKHPDRSITQSPISSSRSSSNWRATQACGCTSIRTTLSPTHLPGRSGNTRTGGTHSSA